MATRDASASLPPFPISSSFTPEDLALEGRSFRVDGRRRRVTLTAVEWRALEDVARLEGMELDQLVLAVARRCKPRSLRRGLEVFASTYFRLASPTPVAPGGGGSQ